MEDEMKYPMTMRFVFPLVLLALSLTGCGGVKTSSNSNNGGSDQPGQPQSGEVRLRAKAEAVINGHQVELNGDFRNEAGRQRLKGDLEDAGLAAGTSISFCLVTSSGTVPLAVGVIGRNEEDELEEPDEAEFELDSEKGQTVPAVAVGDKLEARQGATMSGTADCSATLLISATFQPDNNNEEQEEVRLRAEAQIENQTEVELKGDFRNEFDRRRLKGEFKDGGLAAGASISFCLVTSSGRMALAVAKLGSNQHAEDDNGNENENEAEFELDSEKGQTVPNVVAGNTLEARQGANASGAANCSAPLLISAVFQPKD
jgi:hypothetical protein